MLPRHRGIAAVEWTIKERDLIAGGTVYHLADRMDAGAIAAQEWVFVKKGETARELWERALAPLGYKLLGDVIDYAKPIAACRRSPRTSNSPPGHRLYPTLSTEQRRGRLPVQTGIGPGTPSLPNRSQIYLDVFDSTGTFALLRRTNI